MIVAGRSNLAKRQMETYQPYKVELEQAKNQLIQEGNENPTKEEIEEKTRENLVEEKIREARDQNAIDFYNRDDIEETTKLAMYKYASFLKGELTEQALEEKILLKNNNLEVITTYQKLL